MLLTPTIHALLAPAVGPLAVLRGGAQVTPLASIHARLDGGDAVTIIEDVGWSAMTRRHCDRLAQWPAPPIEPSTSSGSLAPSALPVRSSWPLRDAFDEAVRVEYGLYARIYAALGRRMIYWPTAACGAGDKQRHEYAALTLEQLLAGFAAVVAGALGGAAALAAERCARLKQA